jgi:mevalonate kinase
MHIAWNANGDEIAVTSALWNERRRLATHPHDPALIAAQSVCQTYRLSSGEFTLDAELDPATGVGSSSAMRLGMALCAAQQAQKLRNDAERWEAARVAFDLQAAAQSGVASGYDIATQLIGGLVCMQRSEALDWPGVVIATRQHDAWLNHYVHPIRCGKGAATADLAPRMASFLAQGDAWETWCKRSEELVAHLSEAIVTNHFDHSLRQRIAGWRDLMAQSPARHSLDSELRTLPGCDESWTFKTTGAGGDDAVLIFAETDEFQTRLLPRLRSLGMTPADFHFSSQRAECRYG